MKTLRALESKAAHHWKEFLPAMTSELRAATQWERRLRYVALAAQHEIKNLVAQGYKEHEAEEVVLSQFILLKPEPDAGPQWEQDELQEMESRYQEMMKFMQSDDEDE